MSDLFILGLCYRSDKDFSSYTHQGIPDALMNQPLPRIISRGETFRAAIGERVILPCEVKDIGKFNLIATKVPIISSPLFLL